jgi:hypothetical protein
LIDASRSANLVSEPASVTVFIDGQRVEAPAKATVLDALRTVSERAAMDVAEGRRVVTDSRGLPIEADAPVYGGAIFRTQPARQRSTPRDP